jgi:hypothetical protein
MEGWHLLHQPPQLFPPACTGYCPASSQPPVPPHTGRVRLWLRQSLRAFFFVVSSVFLSLSSKCATSRADLPATRSCSCSDMIYSCRTPQFGVRHAATKRSHAETRFGGQTQTKHSPSRPIARYYMPSSWGYQPSGGPPADSAYAPIGNPWPTRLAPLDQT